MSASAASTAKKLAALAAKTPVGPTQASKKPAIAGQKHDEGEGGSFDPVPDQREQHPSRIAPELPVAESPERPAAAARARAPVTRRLGNRGDGLAAQRIDTAADCVRVKAAVLQPV